MEKAFVCQEALIKQAMFGSSCCNLHICVRCIFEELILIWSTNESYLKKDLKAKKHNKKRDV